MKENAFRTMRQDFVAGIVLASLLTAMPVSAHHSPAMFDLSQDVYLEGTIRNLSWRNPHVYFELEITDADGANVTRRIEAGPASNFAPLGIDRNTLEDGERVRVQVKPNRSGPERTALGWLLTRADGSAIPLHVRAIVPPEATDAQATGLAGTWVPQGPDFANLAVAARAWPLTEAGSAAVEATHEARLAARSQCTPFGPPALMALPSTIIVEQTDTTVTFSLDVMDARRTVHLDQNEHPAQLTPSLHGHSIGRFEGETLVVDTIGYAAHPDGYAFDRPSSAAKHIVERLTLSEDRRQLVYEAEISDPEYIAESVSHRSVWDYRPDQLPSNLPCDTDVAGEFIEDY